MTRSRKTPRTLTREERKLWDKVVRDIRQSDRPVAPQKMTFAMLDEPSVKNPAASHGITVPYVPRQLPNHLRMSTAQPSVRPNSVKPLS